MKKGALFLVIIFLLTSFADVVFPQTLSVTKVGEWGTGYYWGLFVQDNYAYCAASGAGLDIIDVSSPASPVQAANCDTPGSAYGVFISTNYAYIADYDRGLQIIDISNPTAPSLVGSCETPGLAYGVYISGSYAYIADGESGLQIIDVANPAAPAIVGSYDTPRNPRCFYQRKLCLCSGSICRGLADHRRL